MEKFRDEKLKRYIFNASPFLWGILEATNKPERLKELKTRGFLKSYSNSTNPTYMKVNQDLLIEVGVQGILKQLVIPIITSAFKPEVLAYFHRLWEQGRTPNIKYLIEQQLYHSHKGGKHSPCRDLANIFLQVDTQHEFIERWTVFAGLWFEEIETERRKLSRI